MKKIEIKNAPEEESNPYALQHLQDLKSWQPTRATHRSNHLIVTWSLSYFETNPDKITLNIARKWKITISRWILRIQPISILKSIQIDSYLLVNRNFLLHCIIYLYLFIEFWVLLCRIFSNLLNFLQFFSICDVIHLVYVILR